jgi:hypothetical protein
MTIDEPAQKRQKNAVKEWSITFDQTQGLRTLADVVGNILTSINFRITYDQKRAVHFLCIDSIDPQHVCMIQARLLCEKVENIATTGEDQYFCVDSSLINLVLKNVAQHYSIDIVKYSDSADIHINAYETLSNSHHTHYVLPTLVDAGETMKLKDQNYKYTVEIDLGMLRQIVKMGMAFHSQDLNLKVRVSDPSDVATNKISRTTFTIASKGDAYQAHNFHSATVSDGAGGGEQQDSYVIRAVTDSTAPESECMNTVPVYSDTFSASYLNLFLKSMERQIITMKLSQDRPLLVHYPLGADKSYICFVLAPKTAEE